MSGGREGKSCSFFPHFFFLTQKTRFTLPFCFPCFFHTLYSLTTFTQNLISKISHVLLNNVTTLPYILKPICSLSLVLCVPHIASALGRTWPHPILFFSVLCHSATTELRGDARVCLEDLAVLIVRGREKESKKISIPILGKLCIRGDWKLTQYLIKQCFPSIWLLFFENSFLSRELQK